MPHIDHVLQEVDRNHQENPTISLQVKIILFHKQRLTLHLNLLMSLMKRQCKNGRNWAHSLLKISFVILNLQLIKRDSSAKVLQTNTLLARWDQTERSMVLERKSIKSSMKDSLLMTSTMDTVDSFMEMETIMPDTG